MDGMIIKIRRIRRVDRWSCEPWDFLHLPLTSVTVTRAIVINDLITRLSTRYFPLISPPRITSIRSKTFSHCSCRWSTFCQILCTWSTVKKKLQLSITRRNRERKEKKEAIRIFVAFNFDFIKLSFLLFRNVGLVWNKRDNWKLNSYFTWRTFFNR